MEDSQRNGSNLNTLGHSRLNLFIKLRALKGSSAANLDSYDFQPSLAGLVRRSITLQHTFP
jgi:hypothetical protein